MTYRGISGNILKERRCDMDKLEKIMLDYRASKNLSQGAAAEQAGISYQTWCSIENGNQKPSRLTEAKIRNLCERKEKE